jgi:chromosome segregation ATPase
MKTAAHPTVVEVGEVALASPTLPPARAEVARKQTLILGLRARHAARLRRLAELRPQVGVYAETRSQLSCATEEYQTLRAAELRGETIDAVKLREVERRRERLGQALTAGADEEAALSRAVTDLETEVNRLESEIEQHECDLPRRIAAAGRERTIAKLKAGRLRELMEQFVGGLADLLDGAHVSELQRLQYPQAEIRPCVNVRESHDRDELRIPCMIGCPEFEQALVEAAVDVMARFQERAQAALAEITAP